MLRELSAGSHSRNLKYLLYIDVEWSLLPAIKGYWTEPPFELCIFIGEHDTKLLHIMLLLMEWGDKIDIVCACVAKTVISLFLSVWLCILLLWWCIKIAK